MTSFFFCLCVFEFFHKLFQPPPNTHKTSFSRPKVVRVTFDKVAFGGKEAFLKSGFIFASFFPRKL